VNELFKKECRYAIEKILLEGLVPFVKFTMENKYGKNWVSTIKPELLKNYYKDYFFKDNDINWEDPLGVLTLVQKQWRDTFSKSFAKSLSFEIQNCVSELIGVRGNAFGHTQTDKFSFDYTYRALDSIERLLSAIPNDRCAQKKAIESATKKGEILAIYVESQSQKDKSLFSWHEICGVMLLQKQRDSLRRKATQAGAEVNVYVALDLLKREEQSRNDSNSNKEKEIRKATYVIERTFKHDDFLESLTQRQSKNKHIAIAGEAGAGKTTLLATIAEKLHQQGQLTIFISLADLQDKSLYDEIYESWLPRALGLRKGRATEEQKDDLHEQFKLGKVWLLLDGLDEMQSKSSANALVRIESEIGKVIEQSKVVLTCRLNVWDVNLNGLSNFETFRMGKFSQDDVDKFISEWFIKVERPESAPILQAKLNALNRDRIRDMVRHPLRLALLCQVFYRNSNMDLPETKAGLYEQFVPCFYEWNEWKPNIVDEDLTQDTLRKELHLALGKLAIAGIDGDAGFRLSRSLAVKEMGDRLFKLASDVGWLTLIERDEQDQKVYAFYHASFQEYFAALAIDDWNDFLPSDHVDKPVKDKRYRIFSAPWKEVILFWIGNNKEQDKKKFIAALLEFQSGCADIDNDLYEDFYNYKAFFLAASLLTEYSASIQLDNIINKLITLAFEINCDTGNKCWVQDCIREEALRILGECNPENVFISLNKLLTMPIDTDKQLIISEYILGLEAKAIEKHLAIEKMKNLLEDLDFRDYALQVLLRLNPEDTESQGIYYKYCDKEEDDSVPYSIFFPIEREKENIFQYEEPQTIIDLIWSGENGIYSISHQTIAAIERLERICVGDRKVLTNLIDFISNSNKKTLSRRVTQCLKEILTSDLYSLIIRILSKRTRSLLNRAIRSTKNIHDNRFVDNFNNCYEVLWYCAQNMSYPDFYEAWHSQPTSTHPEIVDTIPSNTTNKIQTLESQLIDCNAIQKELDRNTDHPEIRCLVVDIRHLEQESDPNVIAKKLTNKIFNSIGRRIPVVQDISCLERELLNLKFELGFEKLAIALYGKSANDAIHQLCLNLTESIHICPFTGEKSTQQLTNEVKAWLRRINLEYN